MSSSAPNASSHEAPFVCTACGLACDDVRVRLDSTGVGVSPPCPLASAALQARPPLAVAASVAGAPATYEAALAAAAQTLSAARAPLVTGLHRAPVEAIRVAIGIADRLRGSIDPVDAGGASFDPTAAQTIGVVTATLGEVAQRADVIVSWFAAPDATHPRLRERLAREEIPHRRWMQVGMPVDMTGSVGELAASAAVNWASLPIALAGAAARVLRAVVTGVAVDAEQFLASTGVPLEAWQSLAEQFRVGRYVAFVYDAAALDGAATAALTELVVALHRQTRSVALPLVGAGNAVGAVQTLLWQTGFPAAVSFAAGYPEHRPDEATVEQLLARGEVDAALVVGADLLGPKSCLSPAARETLGRIPLVVLDDAATATTSAARVVIGTSRFEFDQTGSIFRTDGVPLPLRAVASSPLPSTENALRDLAARLQC